MYNVKNKSSSEAIAYAIYMIMGSYFKKAVCKSIIKEGQLRVAYSETKRDTQIKMEERCINYIDSRVLGVVPDEIFDDMVEVKFITNNEEHRIDVLFEGFDWKLRMWGITSNKGIMFDYKLVIQDDE